MATEETRKQIAAAIKRRIFDLGERGVKTRKGEPLSMAAIGRTLDPPVTRSAVCMVVNGKAESSRIKRAIENHLSEPYWIRTKRAA